MDGPCVCLTSYTSPLELRTFPLLALLASRLWFLYMCLCVCVCVCSWISIYDSKGAFWALRAALWALHQGETLIIAHLLLCSLSSFMGYEVACLCMCECVCVCVCASVWGRQRQKAGWDVWERICLRNTYCLQKLNQFHLSEEIHHIIFGSL